MKRHFERSIERMQPEPTLSVEEAAILADEHSEAERAMDTTASEVERITEIAEVATDVQLVVSDVPQIGQVEQDLVAAAADMAVAGTDANAEEVLSLTDATGAVSAEGIVSALKSIWDAIVTAIKNMWVGIRHWFTTYFSTLDKNKKHAEALIKKLDGMKGFIAPEGASVDIMDTFSYGRRANGKFSSMFGTVDEQANQMRGVVVKALAAQASTIGSIGESIVHGFNEYTGADNTVAISKAVGQIATNMESYIKAIGAVYLNEKKGVTKSVNVGAMEIQVSGFNTAMARSENSVETQVALLNKVRFSVDQETNMTGNGHGVELSLAGLTPELVKQSAIGYMKFIDQLIAMRDTELKALEAKSDAVQKACEAMLGRIKPDDKVGQTLAKKLMPLATAYAHWATQPAVKLLSVSARHLNHWLSLTEKASNAFVEA
jgi:hypothetical protein